VRILAPIPGPGGWGHVADVAGPLGKFNIFDFEFALNSAFFSKTYTFWAGIAGGCFLTTATHGTDQLMVQRLLKRAQPGREPRSADGELGRDPDSVSPCSCSSA